MFTIPSTTANPSFQGQSNVDATDLAILVDALAGTAGVVTGCTVSQDTGSDMKVGVAAGTVIVNGVLYTVAATGASPLTVQAALSNSDRKDIVVYTVGTGLQVIEGSAQTAGNFAQKPSIPSNSVVLAEIYVASVTSAIGSANLVDKTTIIGNVQQVVAKTANYTVLTGDAPNMITFNGSNLVATLPSSAQADGWHVTIMNLNATELEITPNGLNVNGATTPIYLSQYQSIDVKSDGSNYWAGFGTPSVGSTVYAVGSAGSAVGTSFSTVATLALPFGVWIVVGAVSVTGVTNTKLAAGALAQSTGTMSINNGNGCTNNNDTLASGDTLALPLMAIVNVTVAGNLISEIKVGSGTTGSPVTGAVSSLFLSAVRQG